MTDVNELIDRYLAAWNETDPAQRRTLIRHTWTEAGSYLDPVMAGNGHDGIDALIQGVQARYPGHRFRLTGAVDAHHDHVRFSWTVAPEGGPALLDGTDFAVIAGGRLQSVTGFFDRVPAAAQQAAT